ncbi:MAG: hypothetical protein R3E39_09445 [Anaerolineae bacterium]
MRPSSETTDTTPQKAPHFIWMLPLVMLFAAALACDDYYVPPPMVGRVEADATTAGRVYAEVVNIGLTYSANSNQSGERATYESDDYGMNWRPYEHVFGETVNGSVAVEVYGEMVTLNDGSTWWFPRSIFRGFFYDSSSYTSENRFELPSGIINGSQQGAVTYVPLGTEGVLIRRADGANWQWTLSAKGMDTLSPLPLTITEPSTILRIVLLALFIPPFALIHAYLLSRVWVYLLPADEARQAALRTTGGLVVVAIIGIILWLTNTTFDLYEMIAVVTAIVVMVGVSLTVYMAMQRKVSDYTRNRLAVGALIVSLVVPGGVAAIFAAWWVVFGLVFAFWAYQRVYMKFRGSGEPTAEGRVQRWQTDRLALETMGIGLVVGVVISLGLYFALNGFGVGGPSLRFLMERLLAIPISIFAAYKIFQIYVRRHAHRVIEPKPDIDTEAYVALESRTLVRRLTVHTVLWVVLALIASIATFFGQAWAYGWFTTLLRGR